GIDFDGARIGIAPDSFQSRSLELSPSASGSNLSVRTTVLDDRFARLYAPKRDIEAGGEPHGKFRRNLCVGNHVSARFFFTFGASFVSQRRHIGREISKMRSYRLCAASRNYGRGLQFFSFASPSRR